MLLLFTAKYVYITVVLIFIIIVITWARGQRCTAIECSQTAGVHGIPENRSRKYFRIFSLRFRRLEYSRIPDD